MMAMFFLLAVPYTTRTAWDSISSHMSKAFGWMHVFLPLYSCLLTSSGMQYPGKMTVNPTGTILSYSWCNWPILWLTFFFLQSPQSLTMMWEIPHGGEKPHLSMTLFNLAIHNILNVFILSIGWGPGQDKSQYVVYSVLANKAVRRCLSF